MQMNQRQKKSILLSVLSLSIVTISIFVNCFEILRIKFRGARGTRTARSCMASEDMESMKTTPLPAHIGALKDAV